MSEERKFNPFNGLIKDINQLKDKDISEERTQLCQGIKEKIEQYMLAMGLEIEEDKIEPDEYKWVVINGEISDKVVNIYEAAVFSDGKEAGEFIGISERTFRRKVADINYYGQTLKIGDYTLMYLPYFKSKRGLQKRNNK